MYLPTISWLYVAGEARIGRGSVECSTLTAFSVVGRRDHRVGGEEERMEDSSEVLLS